MTFERPRIIRAENDLLFDEQGRQYVDLFTGHGATWLGHADPEIAAALAEQLRRVWIAPGFELPVLEEARELVQQYFPPSHALVACYSTGMEAAEFALRQARGATGRNGAVGFERSMHGKSLATAYLGWDNRDGVRLPDFIRLPFVATCSEAEILMRLDEALAPEGVSAVFVEPIQGCGGGRMASASFYREVARRCRDHGTLLVFDEILTGFHRTGPAFCFSELGLSPDIVLIGKALGNGFPVSGVVSDRGLAVRPEMLPGSTYGGNPLAATAIVATLRRMQALDLPRRVATIERVIQESLAALVEAGVEVRGRGALWVITVPPGPDVLEFVLHVHKCGVSVGHSGREIRILPAATIGTVRLQKACSVLAAELLKVLEAHRNVGTGP